MSVFMSAAKLLNLDDFDFPLPPELIAQHPAASRTGSRLLHVDGPQLTDRNFIDLTQQLSPGDLLVFNDTKVVKARLFGIKASGGAIEVIVERIINDGRRALAQVRASKSPKPGSSLLLEQAFSCTTAGREGEFFILDLDDASQDWWSLLEAHGHLPLPPYIDHQALADDESRYQTVFARHPGAVAAPTAGLHFDEALLTRLHEQGIAQASVTLHVGAGTFQPVRVQNLAEHKMHCEHFNIPTATAEAVARTRAAGGRVIAVGTTSLRALESAARADGSLASGPGETEIFITPGYRFKVVDRLLTNFHLPKSTLLMLVSAFAGHATMRRAYTHAINERYRFFSYGDAMLLERNDHAI